MGKIGIFPKSYIIPIPMLSVSMQSDAMPSTSGDPVGGSDPTSSGDPMPSIMPSRMDSSMVSRIISVLQSYSYDNDNLYSDYYTPQHSPKLNRKTGNNTLHGNDSLHSLPESVFTISDYDYNRNTLQSNNTTENTLLNPMKDNCSSDVSIISPPNSNSGSDWSETSDCSTDTQTHTLNITTHTTTTSEHKANTKDTAHTPNTTHSKKIKSRLLEKSKSLFNMKKSILVPPLNTALYSGYLIVKNYNEFTQKRRFCILFNNEIYVLKNQNDSSAIFMVPVLTKDNVLNSNDLYSFKVESVDGICEFSSKSSLDLVKWLNSIIKSTLPQSQYTRLVPVKQALKSREVGSGFKKMTLTRLTPKN